jgi:thiol:disulfide interchange protein
MTRFAPTNLLFVSAITVCLAAHAGCGSGMPSLLKTPMLGKSLQADLGSSLRSETQLQQTGQWLTSWELAHRQSLHTGMPIMAVFTGSAWCGPCIALKKNVLKSDTFMQWATENVVLLEVDFPKNTNQPPAIKSQNRELSDKYNVSGYH